jgi:hypothetical protein
MLYSAGKLLTIKYNKIPELLENIFSFVYNSGNVVNYNKMRKQENRWKLGPIL